MSTSTDYYQKTAAEYDTIHDSEPEHTLAFELGWPLLTGAKSVLDVGCGTGRGLSVVAMLDPTVKLYGIEPSEQMLAFAREKVPTADLRQGTGESLAFADESIDVVSAAGIMHHVDNPPQVIAEMFRVARTAILISDHNNYAFGGPAMQRIRMGLKLANLLGVFTYVKQGFNRRGYSKDDGWWYPYSLFDNFTEISRRSNKLYIIPTRPANGQIGNMIFAQSHFCIVAIKATR